ncbi:MAG: Methionine--tRNA ligase [Acidimicrobiales bacterium]|nr:MAG: methionine--tRNA ligase [Actinomycetota bacterium]MBV6508329.1 Methionine--tRNA ligase [Acidimicrobiales bacterium]RIK07110.1 MAG: methionine--tRNA ligase [Acidobacteriota bacterium]
MGRHLITSALPYINGVKHLGNLVGSMLPADVYARYLRLTGHDVLFVCATDEHGTPAELAAREADLDVAEYCAEQHEIQADLGERFGLSWDHFGRTSRPQNCELTQHLAHKLDEHGLIEERTTQQVYSVDDGRFLPDRYIIGTCPNCGYDRARGDQCENCGKLLDPTDLIEARSAVSGSTDLEIRESRHLFLLQSKMADRIRDWIDGQVDWPVLTTSIARKWLDEGLEDRCITRDLSWGVPVDWPGFEDKVFYVWFDAPIGYIAATKEWSDIDPSARDWRSWWYDTDDVRYTQFMAKDNIPFHTLSFPVTLMGSREPWKLADYIKGFNWLTYYGGKFSTSQGRGVFMDDALELLPADYWRYYLMANAPESDDTSFTWELFAEAVNKDLVGTLGNFVNRSAVQVTRHFGDVVPAGGEPGEPEASLRSELRGLVDAYVRAMERMEFRKATGSLRAIWAAGNGYLETRRPWMTIRDDRLRTAATLRTALNLVRVFAILMRPIIPETSERLGRSLPDADVLDAVLTPALADDLDVLEAGSRFDPPALLFRKIGEDDLEEWESRFGGANDS